MVRVWHPEVVPILDDNRLPAAHAEIHFILNALERGGGMWFKHPETQRFYRQEPVLRHLHDLTVSEMTLRGMNHKTPVKGSTLQPIHSIVWLEQDLADLHRKWTREDRWLEHGHAELGSAIYEKNRNMVSVPVDFRTPRKHSWDVPQDRMEECARKHPHREWTKADKLNLAELMDHENRTASLPLEEQLAATRSLCGRRDAPLPQHPL